MAETPAPGAAPAGLAERAHAAARTGTTSEDPGWPDLPWLRDARRIVQRLARTLGIPAEYVAVQPSPRRRSGGWPWPELTVTDSGQHFRFVAAYCDPDQITALELCPFCEGKVPTFPIRSLADLGHLIGGTTTDNDVDLSTAFDRDPGHKPDCLHAAPPPNPHTGAHTARPIGRPLMALQHPDSDTADPGAALTNPAAYVELTFGAAAHARIWVSRDAPAAFTAILEFARSMQPGQPPPRHRPASGPIKKLIDAGLLAPGQTLTWHRRNKGETHQATVTSDARLRLADGSTHVTASGAAMHIAGHPVKGWRAFTTATGETLAQLIASLRAAPEHPGPPSADHAVRTL